MSDQDTLPVIAHGHEKRKPCIAVTGATGFIGRHLCRTLSQSGIRVIPIVRQLSKQAHHDFKDCDTQRCIGDIAGDVDWRSVLNNVDIVIHTAGLITVDDRSSDAVSAFHKVNVDATLQLAQSSVDCGVRKFIMLSSVGVYGSLEHGVPAVESQICNPQEGYAQSKLAAEKGLLESGLSQSMQMVILRPPMVYGPGALGNLQRLAGMVRPTVSAPLGAIDGRRNLLSVNSLCDGILHVVQDEGDVSGIWNIVEPETVSIPEVMQALSRGMFAKDTRVHSIPAFALKALTTLLGKHDEFEKLNRPVLIDGRKFSQRFNWHPALPTLASIELAAKAFCNKK